jgi:pyruvate dehydrogenase complex dehydrogenase (E1) component
MYVGLVSFCRLAACKRQVHSTNKGVGCSRTGAVKLTRAAVHVRQFNPDAVLHVRDRCGVAISDRAHDKEDMQQISPHMNRSSHQLPYLDRIQLTKLYYQPAE